jgi:hypothetical protein
MPPSSQTLHVGLNEAVLFAGDTSCSTKGLWLGMKSVPVRWQRTKHQKSPIRDSHIVVSCCIEVEQPLNTCFQIAPKIDQLLCEIVFGYSMDKLTKSLKGTAQAKL